MTFRFYIQCDDCDQQYLVRYGLGNKFPQEASFQCKKCTKQITVGYSEYGSDLSCLGAHEIDKEEVNSETELIVQNLHPELPINKNSASDLTHFQVLLDMDRIFKNTNQEEFRQAQKQLAEFEDKWQKFEPSFRLLANVSEQQLQQVFKKDANEVYSEFTEWSQLLLSGKWGQNFQLFIEYAKRGLTPDLIVLIKSQKPRYLHMIYDLCSTYMKGYADFQRTILLQKLDGEIDNTSNINVNWNNISKVYGDLYELVGDLFVLPTMLNNIDQGRAFDKFKTESFTLQNYLTTDKGNRAINFEANTRSSFLKEHYFAWLRNGTHHKNCKLINSGEEIELGTGKGGKNLKKMSLVEYLILCNNLFAVGMTISVVIIDAIKENP
jgi:hypothetical protein